MDQWEYCDFILSFDGKGAWNVVGPNGEKMTAKTTSELFNRVGQEGWELYSVVPSAYYRSNWLDYTVTAVGGGLSGNTGSSATAWQINEYRAFFKRKKL